MAITFQPFIYQLSVWCKNHTHIETELCMTKISRLKPSFWSISSKRQFIDNMCIITPGDYIFLITFIKQFFWHCFLLKWIEEIIIWWHVKYVYFILTHMTYWYVNYWIWSWSSIKLEGIISTYHQTHKTNVTIIASPKTICCIQTEFSF